MPILQKRKLSLKDRESFALKLTLSVQNPDSSTEASYAWGRTGHWARGNPPPKGGIYLGRRVLSVKTQAP